MQQAPPPDPSAQAESLRLKAALQEFYELSFQLNIEKHKQNIISSRLEAMCAKLISQLPPEDRVTFERELKQCKIVTLNNIARLAQQRNPIIITKPPEPIAPSRRPIAHPDAITPPSSLKKARSLSPVNHPHPSPGAPTDAPEPMATSPSLVPGAAAAPAIQQEEAITPPVTVAAASSPSLPPQAGESSTISPDSCVAHTSLALGTPLPSAPNKLAVLPHNDVVCAIHFAASDPSVLLTGSKGCVKIWDISSLTNPPTGSQAPPPPNVATLDCLGGSYVRSCRTSAAHQLMCAAGEHTSLAVWELVPGTHGARLRHAIQTPYDSHYALAMSNLAGPSSQPLCYACTSNGIVGAWDLNTGVCVRTFTGHEGAVSCADLSTDGRTLITGGLDNTVKVWDLVADRLMTTLNFSAQVFSLAACPGTSWVAVGLYNNTIEVLDLSQASLKYQLSLHSGPVLSLNFSHGGRWLLSTGKDRVAVGWRAPFGQPLFQTREGGSLICSDIAPSDLLWATGSGEQYATIYSVSSHPSPTPMLPSSPTLGRPSAVATS
ncbi:putative Transcription factor unc-37 [Paratrimastix pyriformis]|uniref:Transcription factor unc-37 n=1 Tax=Paratrimastix pyriformis TaxID=342808 RepID=A0ABQ8U5E3_9EUKA|nr:putative Transcription factor unc-37 [Paratrimastix pyriformis]